jgi:hypothetical protein
MKCPHCGIDAAAHGAEVLKCWDCGRWIEVVWQPPHGSTFGRFAGFKYQRPKRGWRGGWDTRPSQVELLVELCRALWWEGTASRAAGEIGSCDSVAKCLKDGPDKADIDGGFQQSGKYSIRRK